MTKAELRAAVKSDAHRSDLADELVDGFIRRAEGMIARELKAAEIIIHGSLGEADRVADGIYTLPDGLLELRVAYAADAAGRSRALRPVSLIEIRRFPASMSVAAYALRGNQIEIRGTPATDAELELEYYGRPAALDADDDTNDLLTAHEDVYVQAALFHLHKWEEDAEHAQQSLDMFKDAVAQLAEASSRKVKAGTVSPVYQFGRGGGY